MNKNTESYPNPGMGERVRFVRGEANQGDFGKKVGTSQGNVSKIEQGMIPDGNILLRIAQYGKTTIEHLLTGALPVRTSIVSHDEKNLPEGMTLIKKLKGPASAGAGLVPNDEVDIQLAFRDDWLTKFGGPEKLVAMVVEGDSMEPTLNDKDVVVVNKNVSEIHSGGGVYSLVWQGKRMVKRLQFNPKSKVVRIKSDNPRYDDFESSLKDIRIEGKLIWFGREMK